MLPAAPPKLAKWPFILGDVVLLAFAWLLVRQSNPLTPAVLVVAGTCTAIGAVLFVLPFLIEYSRRQEEAIDERQRALEGLSRTVAASAEQISIATSGLQELTSSLRSHVRQIEELSERAAAAARSTPAVIPTPPVAAEEPSAPAIAAEADVPVTPAPRPRRPRPSAPRHQSTPLSETPASIPVVGPLGSIPLPPEAISDSVAPLPSAPEIPSDPAPRFREDGTPTTELPLAPLDPAVVDSTAPVAPDAIAPAVVPTPEPNGNAELSIPPVAPPAAPRKRAARKPRAEPAPDVTATVPEPAVPAPVAGESLSPVESAPVPAVAIVSEPAAESPANRTAADGSTRLLVTAYIGIGNRLFIRGDGSGLSWDKGIPLQFVSIGKWRWESADATVPVSYRLYKNDQQPCDAPGTQTIAPGQEQEIKASF